MKFFKYIVLICFAGSIIFETCAQTVYDYHLEAARRSGIAPLKNTAHINTYVSKKKLQTVFANRGYKIARLTHSRPYLTPKANGVLKLIGSTFHVKSKKNTFTVTSVTRTLADQKRLARVNSNAVTSKLSAHNYGCSFDISYIRFNGRRGTNARLEKMLEGILIQLQKEGKLYFIKEYREKCFHVTAR